MSHHVVHATLGRALIWCLKLIPNVIVLCRVLRMCGGGALVPFERDRLDAAGISISRERARANSVCVSDIEHKCMVSGISYIRGGDESARTMLINLMTR